MRSYRRRRVAGFTLAGALLLAGCAGADTDEPSDPLPTPEEDGDEDDENGLPSDGTDDEDDATDDDAAGDGSDDADDDDDADDGDDDQAADAGDDGVEPLDGDPSTEPRTAEGALGTLAVTEVRLGQHDGFDRVVFELAGDGHAGWLVQYVDEAREQGSGARVEVDGDAALQVALRNMTLPPDLPDTIEVWDEERLPARSGGVITEVVDDKIYEGQHTLFVGTTGQQPFVIERLEDPQRVVIDVFHD